MCSFRSKMSPLTTVYAAIAAYTVVRGGVAKLGGINSTARYNQNYASSSCVMGLVGRSDTML